MNTSLVARFLSPPQLRLTTILPPSLLTPSLSPFQVVQRSWQPEWQQRFDFEDTGESLEVAVKDHHSRVLALAGPATVLAVWPVTYRHLAEDQTHTLSVMGSAVACPLALWHACV